jgi:hypothetical protein
MNEVTGGLENLQSNKGRIYNMNGDKRNANNILVRSPEGQETT